MAARQCSQIMAPLPAFRVGDGEFPFEVVGVDYFGPFVVKKGRGEVKRYACLFTCMFTRAIHIEVTPFMSTESFVLALQRFIARRGQPRIIVSDNGSNFRGAYNELRNVLREWDPSKVSEFVTNKGMEWRFGPVATSHWGGVWERMIRSVRKILHAISKGRTMTDETLSTFMCEV